MTRWDAFGVVVAVLIGLAVGVCGLVCEVCRVAIDEDDGFVAPCVRCRQRVSRDRVSRACDWCLWGPPGSVG